MALVVHERRINSIMVRTHFRQVSSSCPHFPTLPIIIAMTYGVIDYESLQLGCYLCREVNAPNYLCKKLLPDPVNVSRYRNELPEISNGYSRLG